MNSGLAVVNMKIVEQESASGNNVHAFRRALAEVAVHLDGYQDIPSVSNGALVSDVVDNIYHRLLTLDVIDDIDFRMETIVFMRERCKYFTGLLPKPGDTGWNLGGVIVDQWGRPYQGGR